MREMNRWTKTELFGHDEQQFVWGIEDEASHFKITISTDKHGDKGIMLWGCFAAIGSGALKTVSGIMKEENYL